MLSNLKAYVVEGDEWIRRQLTASLELAGVGLAAQTEDADFAVVGSSPNYLSHLIALPAVALEGRADPACRAVSRMPFPFGRKELTEALQSISQVTPNGDVNPVFADLTGSSPAILRVREMMAAVVRRDATVLITGESGTGKEVVARALHNHSGRRSGPFVPVNCGAIPAELIESELFGHEKGAFTGAISQRAGRFEMAKGGTLFLDEIGDLPLPMQVKLLRVLQERTFERVGGSDTIRADVRIIAATHRNLESMIREGRFRDDLFYRLNVFPIDMPALRDRPEDVPALVASIAARLEDEGKGTVKLTAKAMASLKAHAFEGNIRELSNLIERLSILYPNRSVDLNDLPERFRHDVAAEVSDDTTLMADTSAGNSAGSDLPLGVNPQRQATVSFTDALQRAMVDTSALPKLPINGIDLRDFLARLEKSLIEQALDDANDVVAHAADRLHIRRTTLVEKMRKYGLARRAEVD